MRFSYSWDQGGTDPAVVAFRVCSYLLLHYYRGRDEWRSEGHRQAFMELKQALRDWQQARRADYVRI